MKIGAHPLVVAVALGLLAPGALEVVDDDEERTAACGDCGGSADVLPVTELADAVRPDAADAWANVDAPSAEDFHQVELAWLKARDTV
jgi:hypothetical protein